MTTPNHKQKSLELDSNPLLCGRLPYVAVMTIAVIMYKRLGLSNTEIALYTSWLYLPWTIKPYGVLSLIWLKRNAPGLSPCKDSLLPDLQG